VAVTAVTAIAIVTHQQPEPDAPAVLRLAAGAAGKQLEARPDQFIYVESLAGFAGGGPDGWHAPIIKQRKIWLSVDGRHDGLLRETSNDPAARKSDLLNLTIRPCGDPRDAGFSCDPHGAYLRDLPDDRDGMRAHLYRDLDTSPGHRPLDDQAFENVGGLLQEQYLPPAAMAALFEAAATIPGTTVVPDAQDAAGRHGIAVSHRNELHEQMLIFDKSSYRYLGLRDVAARDGALIGTTAQLKIAVVDRAGQST
jgi:hypothetical protein